MAQSQLISVAELSGLLDDENVQVVDCRFDLGKPEAGRAAYLEAHIPGAAYAHLDEDLAGPVSATSGRHPLPDPAVFAEKLGSMGVASTTRVVVYDAGNGAMAARSWWLLRWMGHDNVQLLNGGFSAWLAEGERTESGETQLEARTFEGTPRHDLVMTTEELLAAGEAISEKYLLDARDSGRFRGEFEPIDPVAGHIPGARNLPLSESLNADGRFKDAVELRNLWTAVLGPDAATQWVAMCGSGVTACHLALSGIEAGRAEPRVYVGSWSEWIRDPDRPIAAGDD